MSVMKVSRFRRRVAFAWIPARHLFCIQLVLIGLAASPSRAQQASPADRARQYLYKLEEQLAPFQEAAFTYSGIRTRSTPSKAVAGQWKSDGTLRISARRKSLHITRDGTLLNAPGGVPKHLNIEELLATPDTFLDITIVDVKIPSKSGKHLGTSKSGKAFTYDIKQELEVDTKQRIRGDEWSDELTRSDLTMLLGRAPFDGQDQPLWAACRSVSCDFLSDQVVESTSLSGFVAKTDKFEIRALFDPSNDERLRYLEVARPIEETDIGQAVRATLTVIEVRRVDSKPSFMKLKITVEFKGGVTHTEAIPALGIEESDIELEPSTLAFEYDLSNIAYQEDPRHAWFTLEHTIPNGSLVTFDGQYDKLYEWKDGKPEPIR